MGINDELEDIIPLAAEILDEKRKPRLKDYENFVRELAARVESERERLGNGDPLILDFNDPELISLFRDPLSNILERRGYSLRIDRKNRGGTRLMISIQQNEL